MNRLSRLVTISAAPLVALACASTSPSRTTPLTAADREWTDSCLAAAKASVPTDVSAAWVQEGWKKPELPDRGCIYNIHPVKGWRGAACTRLVVGADGKASQFAVVYTPVPKEQEDVFREAVTSCRFVPARDPEGRPAATWLVLPLRIQSSKDG
jgi:hypothetical protein